MPVKYGLLSDTDPDGLVGPATALTGPVGPIDPIGPVVPVGPVEPVPRVASFVARSVPASVMAGHDIVLFTVRLPTTVVVSKPPTFKSRAYMLAVPVYVEPMVNKIELPALGAVKEKWISEYAVVKRPAGLTVPSTAVVVAFNAEIVKPAAVPSCTMQLRVCK